MNAMMALLRSSLPRLGPISSSRSFVDGTRHLVESVLDLDGLVVGDLVRTDGDVVLIAGLAARLLHDGAREAGVGDDLAGLVGRDRLGDLEVEDAPAGELDAEVEALGDDAGDGQDERDDGDRDPGAAFAHEERAASVTSHSRRRPVPARPVIAGRFFANERRTAQSVRTRAMTRADTIDAIVPMDSVTPKPLTGPLARKNSRPAAMQRRDVGVEDRRPGLVVAGVERSAEPFTAPSGVLLSSTFEHQDVRVDRQADREHEAGEAGQGERRAEPDAASRTTSGRRSRARGSP